MFSTFMDPDVWLANTITKLSLVDLYSHHSEELHVELAVI